MARTPRNKNGETAENQVTETVIEAQQAAVESAENAAERGAEASKDAAEQTAEVGKKATAKAKQAVAETGKAQKEAAQALQDGGIPLPRFDVIANEMMSATATQMRRLMGTDDIKRLAENGHKTGEAFSTSSKTALDGVIAVNKELVAFYQNRARQFLDTTRAMASSEDVNGVVKLQNDYLRTAIAAYADEARKLSDMTTETSRASLAPLSDTLKGMVEQLTALQQRISEQASASKNK